MTSKSENLYAALERIFHEPNRLSIMSALSATADGLTFNELKEECELTDGNLSRHLKALEEAKVIKIQKAFVGVKPQTTVFMSEKGRESFIQYLKALEEVLQKAAQAVVPDKKSRTITSLFGKTSQT
jgi:DNA-binding transcriptional ArsR family regulator